LIFAANFKTNHTRASTEKYIETLKEKLFVKKPEDKVYIFPPATALNSYEGDFTIGVQNAYPTLNGAYTGEIGVEQLEEFGIKTILIGHSERREHLDESQEKVAQKFAFFKEQGYEILYCIGEPLEIREAGDEAVMEYLLAQFDGIDISYKNLIIAYEPIWAIGTGRSATVEEIASTHEALKKTVQKPLLRGVDGVLVGSASLDAESFSTMICHK